MKKGTKKGEFSPQVTFRSRQLANIVIENRCTVRQAAEYADCGYQTVWRALRVVLPATDTMLANKVAHVLDYNKAIRHLRGGEATKIKHKKEKK